MSGQTDRQKRHVELIRLGTEYGNLTDRKIDLWLDMMGEVEPAVLRRAVEKLLKNPERQHLPRIGELLALLPDRSDQRPVYFWNIDGHHNLDPERMSPDDRQRIAAYTLRCTHPSLRERRWFETQVKPFVLLMDPQAFDKELERQLAKDRANLGERDPFANEATA